MVRAGAHMLQCGVPFHSPPFTTTGRTRRAIDPLLKRVRRNTPFSSMILCRQGLTFRTLLAGNLVNLSPHGPRTCHLLQGIGASSRHIRTSTGCARYAVNAFLIGAISRREPFVPSKNRRSGAGRQHAERLGRRLNHTAPEKVDGAIVCTIHPHGTKPTGWRRSYSISPHALM